MAPERSEIHRSCRLVPLLLLLLAGAPALGVCRPIAALAGEPPARAEGTGPAREYLTALHQAQLQFQKRNGRWALYPSELRVPPPAALKPVEPAVIRLFGGGFEISISYRTERGVRRATIDSRSRIREE